MRCLRLQRSPLLALAPPVAAALRLASSTARRPRKGKGQPKPPSPPPPRAKVLEEVKLQERDTRHAVRLLMSRHFSREYTNQRPEDIRLHEERERWQRAHEQRQHRLEEKNRNSQQLLGDDSLSVGDGVLPLFYRPAKAKRERVQGTPSWRAPNPVSAGAAATTGAAAGAAAVAAEAAAGEEEQEGEWTLPSSLQTLCKPDLSVYTSENDIRVRSEDAPLAEEGGATRCSTEGEEDFTATQSAEMENMLRQELEGDEIDPDVAVSIYSDTEDV